MYKKYCTLDTLSIYS